MSSRLIIEARGVTMRFGGVVAVDNVAFSLAEGELRCLIGPNGAGKSTFFKCLTGQLTPTAGQIFHNGEDITGAQPFEVARRGVGIKTQVPNVYDGLSVHENIWVAARRTNTSRGAKAVVERVLESTGLGPLRKRTVGQLAHGERQWVEIGAVLATEPRLVLLDEPTAGMTSEEVERTAELIRELNRLAALVVVEHDMQFIRMIAQRVTVLHQGAILVEDTMDNILHNAAVRDVYLGKKAQTTNA